MAYILMIIPPNEFRDEEFFETKEILEEFGHDITTASMHEGFCKGSRGGEVEAEMALTDVQIDDFDGVVFIGEIGAMVFFFDRIALQIALEARAKKKLIAGIGYGPVIIANSGILDGLHATVENSKVDEIEDQGAIYTGEPVTVDDGIITSSNSQSTREFARTLSRFLVQQEKQMYR